MKGLFEMIGIATAATLTEWSKRTLWRRISDGTLTRAGEDAIDDKTKIHLDTIKSYICISFEPEDFDLIEKADAGNAEAQTDLALLFLANSKYESAIYWLDTAIKQNHTEAMHWLGRCHIEGHGFPKNDDIGIMWIAKAASYGHAISQSQMQAMKDRFTGKH